MSKPKHSRLDSKGKEYIDCSECDRGGNGSDKDKCSCGWEVKRSNGLGCFLGTLRPGLEFETVKGGDNGE